MEKNMVDICESNLQTVKVRPKTILSYGSRPQVWYESTKNGVLEYGHYSAITINIVAVTKQFYCLIAMGAAMKPIWGQHSHDKWLKDFYEYRDNFFHKLAKIFYDYICAIVLGELRHANEHSNYGFDTLENFHAMYRNQVFNTYRKFTRKSVLETGVLHFNDFHNPWQDQYGGYKWKEISEAGLKYGVYPDEVFIDHCFDLEHNNGNIFDKEAFTFFSPSGIGDILTTKRYCENPINLLKWGQTNTIQHLIERGCNIGIFEADVSRFFADDGYIIRFDTPEAVSRRVSLYDSSIYNNYFFDDANRRMCNFDKYDLDDLLEFYHSPYWGDDNMKEVPIFRTNKDYDEYGHDMNRDNNPYRDEDASNW